MTNKSQTETGQSSPTHSAASPQMTSLRLVRHATQNLGHLAGDLLTDVRQEATHIADPAQCGVIVRRHFDGLVFTLLGIVGAVLGLAVLGIYLFTHNHH